MSATFPIRPGVPAQEPTPSFGCDKTFSIDFSAPKRVLITGKDSFIGNSLLSYAAQYYPNLTFEVLDMRNADWKKHDFTGYDSVFHVAGLAHADIGNVNAQVQEKYYKINTDLAIQTAQQAKQAHIKQFIFMSSMIIYGESAPYGKHKMITRHTLPAPATFYGDSKWQADKALRELENENFRVAVLRPPMVYGKGAKGNYPLLSKLAKKLPVFPRVDNQRSMVYIDNLCEFICQLILSGENGIYFPQNREYVNTAGMVRTIGEISGRKVRLLKVLKPCVKIASCVPGKIRTLVNKAFGNCSYAMELSTYKGLDYQKYSYKDSLLGTEGITCSASQRPSVPVSIITVAYNSQDTIARTIESVLAQTYSPIEYLIIDGASTDDTVKIAQSYQEKFAATPGKTLRIISEKDKGMYDALNKGARLATGEIVGNINADDYYEPNAVETMVKHYEQDHFDCAWGNLLVHKPTGNFIKRARIGRWWSTTGWCHPGMFAKRQILLDNPYACQNMYDDWEFVTRLYTSGKNLHTYNDLIAHFNFGGMSTQKSWAQVKKRILMKYAIYRKYGLSWLHFPECIAIESAKYLLG